MSYFNELLDLKFHWELHYTFTQSDKYFFLPTIHSKFLQRCTPPCN